MYEIHKAIPIPIAIPQKMKTEHYSLNHTQFDPTQNSPPSLWKIRLNKRIGGGNPLRKKNVL